MYLSKICIKNFRCFNEQGIEIDFQPGINVIIGENNTGKSALIDVLRLVFSSGPGRRDIYVTPQDFYLRADGISAEEIAFDLMFSSLSEAEEAGFYDLLVMGEPMTAQLHIRYKKEALSGTERIRTSLWGGEKEGQLVSSQTLELINHIFLGALRDAERHLQPGRGSRIGQLIRKLVTVDEEKETLLQHMKRANRSILQENNIQGANTIINTNLSNMYGARLLQQIQLGFMPPDFGHVVDSLRPLLQPSKDSKMLAAFTHDEWHDLLSRCSNGSEILQQKAQTVDGRVFIDLLQISEREKNAITQNSETQIYAELEEHLVGVFGLDQNGMGYNNIIYMGTVLGDLQERKNVEEDSYNALLIEEPEAHLHPQLLDLVFNFLGRVSKETKPPPVQLFITSHSPTLTSRAALNSLILLYEHEGTRIALPLSRCPLKPSHKTDLQRYLDVTKAQLFFAKGVILVEGISEALLLPLFARRLGRRLDQNAVQVVNVAGTSFAPFARLFNAEHPGERIEIPCGILTDDDRCTAKEDVLRLTENDLNISFAGKTQEDAAEIIERLSSIRSKLRQGEESARAQNARALENGNLIVRVAYKTFEYELARIPENIAPMLEALKKIHPTIVKGLRALFRAESFDSEYKAICVWLAAKDAKAEFAQRLAAFLDEDDGAAGDPKRAFMIPKYITHVVEHVAPVEIPVPSFKGKRILHEESLKGTA